MAKSKLVKINKKITEKVISTYKKSKILLLMAILK